MHSSRATTRKQSVTTVRLSVSTYILTLPEILPHQTYYSNRAACYIHLCNFQAGYADAKEALKLDPDFVKAVRRLITCALRLGEYEEVKAVLDEYYPKFPSDAGLEEDLRSLAAVTDLRKAITHAAEKEDYKQAAFYTNQLLQYSSQAPIVQLGKLEYLVQSGNVSEADSYSKDIHSKFTTNTDYLYWKGTLFIY